MSPYCSCSFFTKLDKLVSLVRPIGNITAVLNWKKYIKKGVADCQIRIKQEPAQEFRARKAQYDLHAELQWRGLSPTSLQDFDLVNPCRYETEPLMPLVLVMYHLVIMFFFPLKLLQKGIKKCSGLFPSQILINLYFWKFTFGEPEWIFTGCMWCLTWKPTGQLVECIIALNRELLLSNAMQISQRPFCQNFSDRLVKVEQTASNLCAHTVSLYASFHFVRSIVLSWPSIRHPPTPPHPIDGQLFIRTPARPVGYLFSRPPIIRNLSIKSPNSPSYPMYFWS